MKWFWQRRKKDDRPADLEPVESRSGGVTTATRPQPGRASGRLTALEPADDLLRFVRDVLNAQGARVRVEEDDLIVATLPDGTVARYTTTLARAHAEEQTTLVARGAPALETLFNDASQQARHVALRLPHQSEDPVALALRRLAPLPANACGRCVGRGGEAGAEPWLMGAPGCEQCPLRVDGLALTWAEPPARGRVLRETESQSVELVYRLIGRDRSGRRDEWLRLAFDVATGRARPPLALERIAAAEASTAPANFASAARAASERANEVLRPALEALSQVLRQHGADEFERRVDDVTATHERLKRERPEEAAAIAAALNRELARLAETYGVEAEARLEGIVFVTSPVALVAVETAAGHGPTALVDQGRGTVDPPACAVCRHDVTAGRICAEGHAICAAHGQVCAGCGSVRCPLCQPAPFAHCTLCGEATCPGCAGTCDACATVTCARHAWRCAGGDHVRCIEHLEVCSACGDPLCEAHTKRCGDCGDILCERDARACKTCGEARCARHAAACASCQAPLCSRHAVACEDCGEPVCDADAFTCLGCGRRLSPTSAAAAACASCGVEYCARCRGAEASCPACRTLAALDAEDEAALRQAAEREPAISVQRKWQVGRNARARVFVSRAIGREEAWVVSDAGEVVGARRKGWLAR